MTGQFVGTPSSGRRRKPYVTGYQVMRRPSSGVRLPATVNLSTYNPSTITTQEQAYLDSVATWSADEGGYRARPPGGAYQEVHGGAAVALLRPANGASGRSPRDRPVPTSRPPPTRRRWARHHLGAVAHDRASREHGVVGQGRVIEPPPSLHMQSPEWETGPVEAVGHVQGTDRARRARRTGKDAGRLPARGRSHPRRASRYRPRTAFITFRAMGAARLPPEMPSREMSMAVGSMKTATATDSPSDLMP